VAPQLAVAQVAHLASSRLGPIAEVRLLQALASGAIGHRTGRTGRLAADRRARLARPRGSARSGDASVVALAGRLGVAVVATLDRRRFGMVRPVHAETLELLP